MKYRRFTHALFFCALWSVVALPVKLPCSFLQPAIHDPVYAIFDFLSTYEREVDMDLDDYYVWRKSFSSKFLSAE